MLLFVGLSVLVAGTALAHPVFDKALEGRHSVKASCYACHAKGDDPATGKRYGKEVRNDFGKLFDAQLKDKEIGQRVKQAKKEENDAKKEKLNEALTADFLEALDKIEAMPAAGGKIYAEAIKAGDVENIEPVE